MRKLRITRERIVRDSFLTALYYMISHNRGNFIVFSLTKIVRTWNEYVSKMIENDEVYTLPERSMSVKRYFTAYLSCLEGFGVIKYGTKGNRRLYAVASGSQIFRDAKGMKLFDFISKYDEVIEKCLEIGGNSR